MARRFGGAAVGAVRMEGVTEMGAIAFPLVPAMLVQAKAVEEMFSEVFDKVLDLFHIRGGAKCR